MDEKKDLVAQFSEEIDRTQMPKDITNVTEQLLLDARTGLSGKNTISMPIAEISTLGGGISSLVPALRTVTSTSTQNTGVLYRLANAEVGDTLKVAKNGNYWGAYKTADGTSKFAQIQAVDPISVTNTTTMPINPATMIMAVALFSVEQQLGSIEEMEQEIISFLEIEQESEIEADVETLHEIMSQYKYNWDNNHFTSGNHSRVLLIQRTARKNMLSFQKKVNDVMKSKKVIIAQSKVTSTLNDLLKKFTYYRLSLFTYSLASLLVIMLSGNFKEENILGIQNEIENMAMTYRELFRECSLYLEQMSSSSIETNMLRGIGVASQAVGNMIGRIPVVNRGPVDEFLQDKGSNLSENATQIDQGIVKSFAKICNPETGIFVDKMKEISQIYNHTTEIYFDEQKVYLVTE